MGMGVRGRDIWGRLNRECLAEMCMDKMAGEDLGWELEERVGNLRRIKSKYCTFFIKKLYGERGNA